MYFIGTYKDGVSPKGYVLSDHMLLGSVVATILVIVVTVQIALDTSYWTIVNHIMVWGSVIWYFILDYFYNFIIGGSYVGSLTMVNGKFFFIILEKILIMVISLEKKKKQKINKKIFCCRRCQSQHFGLQLSYPV